MSDPATSTEPQEKRWTSEQALSLFKVYEDRGWQAKQQMVSMVTWLTPIIFGLLAYSVKSYDPASASSASASASPASAAALALSMVMTALIWGALKRADNIYELADKVISKAKATGVLPAPIEEIVPGHQEKENNQEQKKKSVKRLIKDSLIYCLRLGLTRIARVYIWFVYLSVILVVCSFVLWWRPRVAGILCGSACSLINYE
jgi:hypothetical protein